MEKVSFWQKIKDLFDPVGAHNRQFDSKYKTSKGYIAINERYERNKYCIRMKPSYQNSLDFERDIRESQKRIAQRLEFNS